MALEELKRIPTASLSDALDRMGIRGTLSHGFQPTIEGLRIAGPAVTMKDKLSTRRIIPIDVIEAIDRCMPGDIIVRVVEGDARDIALYGGLMSLASKLRGIAGAVLDGALRDYREVKAIGFQIFYKSKSPNTSVGRTELEALNVPVICGGILIRPGDIIVGDDDGLVCIPKEEVFEVLKIAREIDELERKEIEELSKGEPFPKVLKKYLRL